MRHGRISLVSLLQVLAVAENLNFRHAANAMGISQSSVSARIKALEEDLGTILFERHARGVRLTEAGKHFVRRVATSIDQLDHAVSTVGMLARGERGCLRIGVYAFVPGGFLASLIARFREKYPCIEVRFVEGSARSNVSLVREGVLDLAFMPGRVELPDCRSRSIWTERLFVAVSIRHLLAVKSGVRWTDLANCDFIVSRGGNGPEARNIITSRFNGTRPDLSIRVFDVERSTILSMVGDDHGITIVGEEVALHAIPGVVFLPIVDEPEPLPFSAVWSPHNRCPALRSLLDLSDRLSRERPTV